jgi:hypothetical protein
MPGRAPGEPLPDRVAARRCRSSAGGQRRRWTTDIGVPLGAGLERGRAIAAGHDPAGEPFLELRADSESRKVTKRVCAPMENVREKGAVIDGPRDGECVPP